MKHLINRNFLSLVRRETERFLALYKQTVMPGLISTALYILVFGKALGNGYAVTAVIGRKEMMKAAETTFISSTFWTERIGPSAALKTLEVMECEKSWDQITAKGLIIKEGWQQLADKYEIEIIQWGLPSLTGFTILSDHSLIYKTFITQEMLAKGFLASTGFYALWAHQNHHIDSYFEAVEEVFGLLSKLVENEEVEQHLKGPVRHSGFYRLA